MSSRLGLRRALQAPLFVQVLSVILFSLAAVQALALGVILNLPPPTPVIYRASEIVASLRGGRPVVADAPPLILRRTTKPPFVDFVGHYTRETIQELSRRLNAPESDLVVANEPPPWLPFRGPRRYMRSRAPRSPAAHEDHILIAPFRVAWRQPDGSWLVSQPQPVFPNPWQLRILLWFVLSALALVPVAYLFARRLSAPISAFAGAAERLGRDPGAPPLKILGPAEIERAAAAFNEMQNRLRRYVEDRTAMVGAVAHDLRTPLTRLRFRVESAPEPIRAKMAADIDQMDAMISSALAFVRDATRPAQRSRLELVSLVESIADEMSETGLEVSAETSAPVVVEGDPVALRRLVTNLLDNAVKFGDRARARVYADAGSAVIEVDDDGPGVPIEERERVFEPFRRGEPSRSRETGGAGLGLAVVRSIARAHGGDAELDNRPEGGLRARAHLPF